MEPRKIVELRSFTQRCRGCRLLSDSAQGRLCSSSEFEERKRGLELPLNDPPSRNNSSNFVLVENNSLPVKSVTLPVAAKKTELMRDCLRSLKHNYKDDDTKVRRAFQTLLIYIRNVAQNPNEEKFRKIRLSNPAFQVIHVFYGSA
ncbi:hypothetical protein U1Q18_046185 [Sarracenia purpurea var. burkii]